MTFVLVVALILVTAMAGAHFLRTSVAAMVPTTLFGITIVLYAFGVVNALLVGVFFVVAAGLALGATALARTTFRVGIRGLASSARDAVTPALVVFFLFALIAFLTTRGMRLSSWDEFTEWGAVVKAMVLENKISVYNPVNLTFAGYQPGLGLFQYLVQRLGGWSEGNLFWAYQLLVGSLFIPFLGPLRWRRSARLLLIVPMIIIVPVLFFPTFQLVIVDPFLGLLFGYCLALVYTGSMTSRRLTVHLTLALVMLVLTKDAGTFLAIVVLVALLAKYLHQRYPGTPRQRLRGVLGTVAIPIVGVALAYVSWKTIIALVHIQLGLTAGKINLAQLIDGPPREYWGAVWSGFGAALVHGPLIASHNIQVPQVAWLAIGAALLVLLELWRGNRWGRTRDFSIAIVVTVGAAVYTVGLLLLYLFSFDRTEAIELASFGRYLSTYWVGVTLFITLCVIAAMSEDVPAAETTQTNRTRFVATGVRLSIPWLILLLVFAPATSLLDFVHNPVTAAMASRADYEPVLNSAKAAKVTRRDRLWIVSEKSNGYDYWVLRYGLMPSEVNVGSWSLGSPYSRADLWTSDFAVKTWASRLRTYDYVVIYRSSPQFVAKYRSLFVNPHDVANNTVFAVARSHGTVRLTKVP